MLQLLRNVPDFGDFEPHWLLANLRFESIQVDSGTAVDVVVVNDGYAESTECDVVARAAEVEGSSPPFLVRYEHDERSHRLRTLGPGESEGISFGRYSQKTDADLYVCVIIDPPTPAHPIGETRETTKLDNTVCAWRRWLPADGEEPPDPAEPVIVDDPHDGYRLYRTIFPISSHSAAEARIPGNDDSKLGTPPRRDR